jgi:tight adherence protein B
MTDDVWGIASLVAGGLAAFLVFFLILEAVFGRTPMQRRIATLRLFTVGDRREDIPPLRKLLADAGRAVEESPMLARYASRGEPLLDQMTGSPRPSEWLAIRVTAAIALGLGLAVLLPWWLGGLVGLLAGFHVPPLVLRSRIQRRRQGFADDLPGVLHLMLSSLRSGFTLQQAVEAAVHDEHGPVAEELSRALSESRISGDFENALERVGERVRSRETMWLVMALRLQREVGGSLAEVMQTTAETMQERAYLRRHVRTLSAEGRLSAYVLTALPVGVAVLLFITRRDYLEPLYTEPLGWVLIGVAVLMLLVGMLWLRVMARIEV